MDQAAAPAATRFWAALMQELALLATKKQKRPSHYSPHASSDRDVDRLFVLNRQLERAHLGVVGLLDLA